MARGKILGIDIGSSTIKLALVKNGYLVRCATVDMPRGLMQQDSRLSSTNEIAELLTKAMRDNGIRARRAAIVVSNEVSYLRELTLPRMTVGQLEKNLPYEFRNYIDGDPMSYYYDYEMLSEVRPEDEEMQLMAVAFPKEVFEEMWDFIPRAGLKLVRIAPTESALQGLIRQSANLGSLKREYCFLNLGHNATRMFMFKGDRHMATRILETGLSSLETAISDGMNVDRRTAHDYLLTNYADCQTQEFSMEIYRAVAVELMRALNFYMFSNPDSDLKDLWIGGGGCAIPPLLDTINETLEITVHTADDLIRTTGPIEGAYNYLQAVGITMDWR